MNNLVLVIAAICIVLAPISAEARGHNGGGHRSSDSRVTGFRTSICKSSYRKIPAAPHLVPWHSSAPDNAGSHCRARR
jgi:hypothetical protein